jgi:hypothetical protein
MALRPFDKHCKRKTPITFPPPPECILAAKPATRGCGNASNCLKLCFNREKAGKKRPSSFAARSSVGLVTRVSLANAKTRLSLYGLTGLMTGATTLTVGPLSFVGLMGPHLAREAGLTRALPQMIGSAAIGGAPTVMADFLGRTIAAPYQIPARLVSAMIGAPFLMFVMRKRA